MLNQTKVKKPDIQTIFKMIQTTNHLEKPVNYHFEKPMQRINRSNKK